MKSSFREISKAHNGWLATLTLIKSSFLEISQAVGVRVIGLGPKVKRISILLVGARPTCIHASTWTKPPLKYMSTVLAKLDQGLLINNYQDRWQWKRDVSIKSYKFKDTRQKIYVPLAMSTNIRKKVSNLSKKERKKNIPGPIKDRLWEKLSQMFTRSGEIPSPR